MKAVILAGGYGTRISEETTVRPKPMVEIGDMPILWHIMMIYASHGIREFVICCGYKGHVIKEYFANYFHHVSDFTVDLRDNSLEFHRRAPEDWRVTLIDTGEATMTGGRIRRIRQHIGNETFCMTYGDGVADVDISRLVKFHREAGVSATLTAVRPPGRFGAFHLDRDDPLIRSFREKPDGDGAWINGGFFVLEPAVFDLIEGDHTVWEREPMERLAHDGELAAFHHLGFWQPMDTLRDRMYLEDQWKGGTAPWKTW